MLAQRRMFRTITGKLFCPIAAIAAPKAFGRARLADESPARLWQSKGRFGRGLGNPTVGFWANANGGSGWKNQVGSQRFPNSLRSLYTTHKATREQSCSYPPANQLYPRSSQNPPGKRLVTNVAVIHFGFLNPSLVGMRSLSG
jgi:hypothetical protein